MARIGDVVRKWLVISGVSLALSLALYLSGLLTGFEFKAYDLFSRSLNPRTSAGDILLVAVDQRSIDALSGQAITWPWPRQMYAPLFDYLSQADAVFFDVLTTEPSSYGVEDDALLAQALKKASNVYLPVFLSQNPSEADSAARDFLAGVALPAGAPQPYQSFRSAILPLPEIRRSCRGAGNVAIKPDADGVYRGVPLNFGVSGKNIPQFVLGYLLAKGVLTVDGQGFAAAGTRLPMEDGSLLLRFYRSERPFPVISAADVFQSHLDEQEGGKPALARSFFKGKKVFIGLTAAGLYDLKPTAVSSISTGVLVHATALDNLLHRNWMTPLPRVCVILFMLVICLTVSYFILTHFSLPANLMFISCAAGVTLGAPALLFAQGGYLLITPPLTALVFSALMAAAYSYATEGKERRFVRRTFSQYMDETIVRHILKNPELIRPGGRRKRVTVFFLDIAGFTPIAENLPAEETAAILHTLLNAFTEVVIRNKGVIDKYIGDSIMAFWGAPLETDRDEENACRAALECLDALAEINREFRGKGLAEIAVRIGIHSGEAVVGNLGSDRLFDYTVVGDTVNLASRLESANKFFRTRILVSADTFERTGDTFLARELGLIAVKGKSLPVKVFEILAAAGAHGAVNEGKADLHRQALALYYEKRWRDAVLLFDRILEIDPGDGPAAWYRGRCESMEACEGLPDEWQVITMKEK
jgi:adenylate cyclase